MRDEGKYSTHTQFIIPLFSPSVKGAGIKSHAAEKNDFDANAVEIVF